jgi:uncharacterized membrane protein
VLVLILGLIIFLGVHSVRIFAEGWRQSIIARLGDGPWKGIYSVLSVAGFILIIWGYGLARQDPWLLWPPPPMWLRHIAILLNLIALLLFALYLVPTGYLKARLGHPMLLSIKVWAFAHLLSNNTLADLILFGAFLIWALADFGAARRRDRVTGIVRDAGPVRYDAIAVVVGFVVWAAILWRLHEWVVGVSPLA